jgi:hypothetical protein
VICGRYEEHLPQAAPAPSALFLFLDRPRHGAGFVTPRWAPERQQTLGFAEPEQGPDTGPLLSAMRERFGGDPFAVEEAIEFARTTTFLTTHVKNLTLAPAGAGLRPPPVA